MYDYYFDYHNMTGVSLFDSFGTGLRGNFYELPEMDLADAVEKLAETYYHLSSKEAELKFNYLGKLSKESLKRYRFETQEGE